MSACHQESHNKPGKPYIAITRNEIIAVCHLKQDEACSKLGVGKTTLKSRFGEYEDLPSRWDELHNYFRQRGELPGTSVRQRFDKPTGRKKGCKGQTIPELTMDDLMGVCHLRMGDAASVLGMSNSTLRNRLSALNIKGWQDINPGRATLFLPLETSRGDLFQKPFAISPDMPRRQELPPGWEAIEDPATGILYYADHQGKKTTWEHPGTEECPTIMRRTA